MQTERRVAANPQTKPTNLGCESARKIGCYHPQTPLVMYGLLYTPLPHVRDYDQRIVFKLRQLMHLVHTGRAPSYLGSCVTASADVTSRPCLLSTSSQRYELQRTRLKFGERSFSCAGPRTWNSLLSSLHVLTDTGTFKRHLFNKYTSSSLRYMCCV